MTSPGQHNSPPAPNPTVLAKPPEDGRAAEEAISGALAGLDGLSELPVAEHVERFESVHTALTDALSRAENLLSGSSGHGS